MQAHRFLLAALLVCAAAVFPASASAATTEHLTNGSFESGFTGWTTAEPTVPLNPWTAATTASNGYFVAASPQDGTTDALQGFDGSPGSFTLTQQVTIPANSTATLSWKQRLMYAMFQDAAARTQRVRILDATNAVLSTPYTFSTGVGDGTCCSVPPGHDTGWTSHSVDLSEFAGQTVKIQFESVIPENFTGPGQAEFDALSLLSEPSNAAPTVDTAASDANGTEGDTLLASGAFSDSDVGDTLTLTADDTEGTFTDNGDGTWSWSFATTDDVATTTITVTADDGNGGTVTDSFDYSAANANPTVSTAASDANGTQGDTLTASGAFDDVSGDEPLTLTADNTVGSFTDNGDGTWSWSYPSAAVGSGTITVTADDGDGGTATDSFDYDVNFGWAGFFSPVANKDGNGNYILNKVKAGSSVPVKFSLGGDQGLDIFADGYPKSEVTNCTSNADDKNGTTQTTHAGGSGLSYNSLTQQYTYPWQTINAWANSCRQLVVKLDDGTYHRANFKFTK